MLINVCCDMFAVNVINNITINCSNELLMCCVKIQLGQNRASCFYIGNSWSSLSNDLNRYNKALSVRFRENADSPETLKTFSIFRDVKGKFNPLYLFPSFSETGGDSF